VFDCRQIKTRLGRYHDGELPHAERLLVESHLQGCRLCSQELEEIRQFSTAFQRALVTPTVPVAMAHRIMAQARAHAGGTSRPRDLFRFWSDWSFSMRFAAVAVSAAACYIGLVIGSALLPSSRSAGDEMQWIGLTSRGPIVTAYVGANR
jgi:anti-sigma factor RsiW